MLGLLPWVIFAVLDQHFLASLRCRPVLWNWRRIKGSGFFSTLENEKPIAPEPLRTIHNVNLAERPWWRKINSNPSTVASRCVDRGKSSGARRGGNDLVEDVEAAKDFSQYYIVTMRVMRSRGEDHSHTLSEN